MSFGVRNPGSLQATYNELQPDQVSNLVFWVSSDTNCFSDLGVTPCADGDRVRRWGDRSGYNRNLGSERGTSQRPFYYANRINGLPIVDFGSGVVQYGMTNWFGQMGGPARSWFLVYCPTGTPGVSGWVYYCNSSENLIDTGSTTTQLSGSTSCVGKGNINEVRLLSSVAWASNGIHFMYRAHKKVGTSTVNVFNNWATNMMVGNTDVGNANARLFGWIAEIIHYDRYLTESERIGIELYLKKKYALPNPF